MQNESQGRSDGEILRKASTLAGMERSAQEAPWDELGVEQKVERLRRALRLMAHQIDRTTTVSNKASEVALLHEHGRDGRAVMHVARDAWGNPANMIVGNPEKNADYVERLLR